MVSRETPPAAAILFGDRLPQASAYVDLLAGPGVERGLIGPRETPRLWHRHVLNCAVLSDVVPHGHRVADIGSGAGLPGLVLGIARPDLRLTLIEPLERRCAFLREAVEVLGLGNVVVIRARAEQMHGTERFDAVTSRAVAPLSRLLTWSMPLVSDAGAMLAMKGSSAAREVSEAAAVLADLRCAAPEILTVGSAHGEHDPQMSPATVVRVAHADPVPVALRESDRGRGPRRRGRRKAGT